MRALLTAIGTGVLALVLTTAPLSGQQSGEASQRALPGGTDADDPEAVASTPTLPVEDILINLRMGRISERLVSAAQVGSTPYLPIAAFLELSEILHVADGEGALRATRQPGAIEVLVDAPGGRVRFDGRAMEGVEDQILWRGERILVAPRLLEELFGVSIHTNFSDLHAVVMNPEVLPVGRRIARERRRLHAGTPGDAPSADRTLGRTPYRTGGTVLDWSTSFEPTDPGRTAHVSLGAGAQLLGGSLQLSARNIGPIADGVLHTGASYHIAWPQRSVLRQLRLGDGLGSGPRPRALRGIHLTNAPYVRESYFGTGEITGRLGPGWEVELRRQGRTLDMSRADEQGAFALDVPLSYGTNPIEVVAYGAHGEVVTMERLMVLRQDRLPGGDFEWGLSAGECRTDRCLGSGNLDLRLGLSDRWTLRAGTEGFVRDSVPSVLHPYLELAGALHPSVHLSVEGVLDGFARATVEFTPTAALRLRSAHTQFQKGLESPALHDARRRATTEIDIFWRPIPSTPRWSLRGSAVHEERADDWRLRFQATSSLEIAGYRVELGVRDQGRYQGLEDTHGLGPFRIASPELRQVASVRGRLPLPAPSSLSPWLLAEVETARWDSITRGQLRISYPIAHSTQLNLTAGWDALSGHRFTAGLQATLDPLRSVTQIVGGSREPTRTIQYAQGSVQWNEATGGIHLDSGPGVERAGLSGYAFLDENGDGRRDAGEEGLPGVRVLIEGRAVMTDERGRYSIGELVPWEMTRVELDPLSLPNPLWVPALGRVDLPLPPSSYRRLDLPVVPGREISGRVVRLDEEGREEPVAGLEIVIVDLVRPEESIEVTTFSDGGFYVMGLRPGAYEFQVPPELLERIESRQDHPNRAVVIRPDGATSADRIVIRLAPRPAVTASPR